jgi:hypothetical protein
MTLLLLIPLVIPIIGVFIMSSGNQKHRDAQRITYRLDFPREMSVDMFAEFTRSINGSFRRKLLGGTPTFVMEMWSTEEGIRHFIKIPSKYEDAVVPQIRGHVPGMTLTLVEEPPERVWSSTIEFNMANAGHQLFIKNPAGTALSMLQAVETIEEGQGIVVQLVVSPIGRQALPQHESAHADRSLQRTILSGTEATRDEVNDRRAKLDDANVGAALRVATVAKNKRDADRMLERVKAVLRGMESHKARFKPQRLSTAAQRQQSLQDGRTPLYKMMQLSSPEFAALSGWPFGSPAVAGLPPYQPRQFPPSINIPTEGIVIGQSTFAGRERRVAIGYDQALMHTHVLGRTGTGKTVLLANMARQIMEAKQGLIMIEQSGNLYQAILDYVPADRIDDVVLMDVSDGRFVPGYNPLDQSNPAGGIKLLKDMLAHKYGLGQWANEYLTNALRTIREVEGLSFLDLTALLSPRYDEQEWADHVTRQVKDDELKRWWQRQGGKDRADFERRAETVLSRLNEISIDPQLRAILGQTKSTVKIHEVMSKGQILLVNLRGIDAGAAELVGTALVTEAWEAAQNTYKEKPVTLMLDEFAGFVNLPIPFDTMLSQARKYNLPMVLAHQYMGQATPEVREATITNARNKIILQSSSTDARLLLPELGQKMDIEDITNLPAYNALARLETPNGSSAPVSVKTFDESKRTGNTARIVAQSRERYARPIAEVRDEIAERRTVKPSGPRPKIGSLE